MLHMLGGACLAAAAVGTGSLPLEVQTPDGTVKGALMNNTRFWRGIPFAQPPVGKNRFRPPVPVKPFGMLDLSAGTFAASCMQMGSPQVGGHFGREAAWNTLNLTNSSEDCLYLNVYAPATINPAVTESLLPVMVYLHAGEFRFGAVSGCPPARYPAVRTGSTGNHRLWLRSNSHAMMLANDAENAWPHYANGSVILVTANARLGLFGFAALDVLRPRDPNGGSSGNYGMQDQRAVLQWVKRSIEAFGGDPNRVTIFGESSGGSSVGFHVMSKKSAGLVNRAILESPGLTQSKPWEHSESNTQFAVAALTAARSPGCEWPSAASSMDPSAYREYPGLVVSSHYGTSGISPLGIATSLDSAKEKCNNRSDCFLIKLDHASRICELYGGGTPGQFSENDVLVFNESTRVQASSPTSSLYIRQASQLHAVDCLVQSNGSDLVALDISPPYTDTFYTDTAAPTEDGVELTMPLSQAARTMVPHNMSLLGGSNLDEGTEFMDETPYISCNASLAELDKWATMQFGNDLGMKISKLYASLQQPVPLCSSGRPHRLRRVSAPVPQDAGIDTSNHMRAMRSAGDSAILCRIRDMLQLASQRGGSAWWYLFTATPLNSVNWPPGSLPYEGAFHGAEVPFVFGDQFELSSDGERALSRAMGCFWINFAATGNPNNGPTQCADGLIDWPEVSHVDGGIAIEFTNTSLATLPRLKHEVCEVFARYP